MDNDIRDSRMQTVGDWYAPLVLRSLRRNDLYALYLMINEDQDIPPVCGMCSTVQADLGAHWRQSC